MPVEDSIMMLVFGVLDLGIWFIRVFHLVTAHHPPGSKCHLVSFHGRTCVVFSANKDGNHSTIAIHCVLSACQSLLKGLDMCQPVSS